MKIEAWCGFLVALLLVCLACSMWFRADSVDAGITDQQVDSLEAEAATPDTLEGDSLEAIPDPFILEEIPEETEPEPEGV